MRRQDAPAAIVDFGGDSKLWIFGDVATYGVPTVELQGVMLDQVRCMRPEDADRFADGLKLAARLARGETVPTPLDEFLSKNTA